MCSERGFDLPRHAASKLEQLALLQELDDHYVVLSLDGDTAVVVAKRVRCSLELQIVARDEENVSELKWFFFSSHFALHSMNGALHCCS